MRHAPWPRRRAATAALLLSQLLARAAFADDSATRNAARELGTSGVEAYLDGRYEQANDELEKAYTILRVPSLGLWSARALVKRLRLVEAAARYRETIGLKLPSGDVAIQKKAIEDARKELGELLPTIPTLLIRISDAEPAQVQVRMDGELLPPSAIGVAQAVNPGPHRIVGQRGVEQVTAATTSSEGQAQELELKFGAASAAPVSATSPAPARPPAGHISDLGPVSTSRSASPQRTWSVVALAAGGAGLAFGGVTGVLALKQHKTLEDTGSCVDGCPASLESDVDKLDRYRSMSTIGFIAGGALVAAGVVLWVTAPVSAEPATRVGLGPGGIVLARTF